MASMQPTTWDSFWHPQNVPILFYPGFELQDGMTCCDSQEGRFVGIPLRDLKKFLVFMQEFCGKSILGEPATQGDWGLSVRWIFDLDNRIYLSPCLPLQNIWPLGLYKHGFMQMYSPLILVAVAVPVIQLVEKVILSILSICHPLQALQDVGMSRVFGKQFPDMGSPRRCFVAMIYGFP